MLASGLAGVDATVVNIALHDIGADLRVDFASLQGVGGALLMPASLAILEAVFDADDRGRAIVAWFAFSGATSAIAPFVGGWLLDVADWRWVFLINPPLAVLVVVIAVRHVPETHDAAAAGRLDVAGSLLCVVGLGALTAGLIAAGERPPTDVAVWLPMALAVAALIGFLVVERRQPHPMLPLALFRIRAFTATNAVTFLLYAANSGALLLLVVELSLFRPDPAARAGWVRPLTRLTGVLTVGLTGGIAAGKSVVAARLRELGAVLIDADVLAREVVAPGTDGLAAVVDAFGSDVLTGDGHLDRGALGALVFGDDGARATLNGIVHPRVRAEAARRIAAAPRGSVIVQDIPLLVETGQEDAFHLVVVVQAAEEDRIRRMVEQRGMSAEDARSRIAAQATDAQREAAADVVLANAGTVDALRRRVDELWHERIVPYNENLLAGRPAVRVRPGGAVSSGVAGGAVSSGVASPDGAAPGGKHAAERIARRLARAGADLGILRIERQERGEDADESDRPVDPQCAEDAAALVLRVVVPDHATADRLWQPFADAGFPRVADEQAVGEQSAGERAAGDQVPSAQSCWLHRSCDPGQAVDVQVCSSHEGASG